MHGLHAFQMTFELSTCSEHVVTSQGADCVAHLTAVSKADTHSVIDDLYTIAEARATQGITYITGTRYSEEQRCD